MTAEEHNKQTNYDKVQHDSSGLSLRTRTISSTTMPAALHQLSTSATSAHINCCTPTITGSRPRGRPKLSKTKMLNRITNGKILKKTINKKTDKNIGCTTAVTEKELAATSLERLHQQLPINQCNGTASYYDKQGFNSNVNTSNRHSTLSLDIDKSKECSSIRNKRSISRKRKQSDVCDVVAEKRLLISSNPKVSFDIETNSSEVSSSVKSKETGKDVYSFLLDRPNMQLKQYHTVETASFSGFGHTYKPINWEYSAVALTGHVQKKISKDSLRKIRIMFNKGTSNKTMNIIPSYKANSSLKKCQRRGSASKFSSLAYSQTSTSQKHQSSALSTIVKRKKGRPPGKKNKIFQAVIKSNSPRKSPRQHASTLAAIMSNKVNPDGKPVTPQPDNLVDLDAELNKNPVDSDGPCILSIAVPKNESKHGVRHYRRRRQLDHQHSILERRRKRRSITPPPPKLSAQQPAPPRNPITAVVADQEVVKLRTKNVDLVRRRARDERLRTAFVFQQLRRVNEVALENQRYMLQDEDGDDQKYKLLMNPLLLNVNQEIIWSSQSTDNNKKPDNMCLQIMYEQTGDKRFLCTNLTEETLQFYHQQRDLALAERLSNNLGDTMSCDLGTDMVNKRKKKRPNMTGWPKEKRRKTIAATNSSLSMDVETLSDEERENIAKRRRAIMAEKQKLRRRRIKLEQQQLAKEKSKIKVTVGVLPKRPGRRPGPIKKNKTKPYRRTTSASSTGTTKSSSTSSSNTTIKERKRKVQRRRKIRTPIQNKTNETVGVPEIAVVPIPIMKRSLGRPKGSMGRKKLSLENRRSRNHSSLPSEQLKENVVQPQTSSGKLKCVISTRNNRIKLLSTSSGTSATSSQKKTTNGGRSKKLAGSYNIASSCLSSSLSETVGKSTRTTAKRKRLQHKLHQQQINSATWDVGRPKRYHSTNHSRSASGVAVEEDYCFVGSQPFEQHCPGGGGGLSQNTVLENQDDHLKENTVHNGDL